MKEAGGFTKVATSGLTGNELGGRMLRGWDPGPPLISPHLGLRFWEVQVASVI